MMTWIDIILPFICMGAVTADELWSEWYGRLSGTTHLIESSLDGDSIETVCVGTTHVIETSLDYVSAIKATFASGTVSGWFGGSYDTESCFTLSTDEYIVSVLVKAGAIIDAVQFTSSLGNTYGPYGGVGGTPYTVSGPDFEALLKMEVVAGEWSARNGTYITQMRFYFDDPDASSASVDHLAHFDGIGALNQVSMDTITVTVTAKDLFILLLVIANVFTLTMLVCQCRNRWNGMGNKVKYEAVNVLSENEILQQ